MTTIVSGNGYSIAGSGGYKLLKVDNVAGFAVFTQVTIFDDENIEELVEVVENGI